MVKPELRIFLLSFSADSGVLDEMSNWDGKSYGWLPRGKMADFVHKGVLKLAVEMKFVHTVSEGKERKNERNHRNWIFEHRFYRKELGKQESRGLSMQAEGR